MNFQQLRFVISVVDTGSFTRAADLCCVTQPALSNAINQLEDELGAKLLDRTTRSVSVTDFGALLIGQMRDIVEARVRLLTHAAGYLARDDRTVRIGLSPLVSAEFVEGMLARSAKVNHGLNIVLTEMNKADIQPALMGGAIDYGLGPAPFGGGDLRTLPIYQEPLLYVSDVPNGAGRGMIGMPDLPGPSYLMVQDDCGLSGAVRALFRDNQLPLTEYEGRALGYHILEKWARLGIGVTLLPASKVTDPDFARPIDDGKGTCVMIGFEAIWAEAQEARSSFGTMRNLLAAS